MNPFMCCLMETKTDSCLFLKPTKTLSNITDQQAYSKNRLQVVGPTGNMNTPTDLLEKDALVLQFTVRL